MIRHLFLACLVLAASAISVLAQYPYESVCTVKMTDLGFYGSGTLIAVSDEHGLVLTCAHVAEKKGEQCELEWTLPGVDSTGVVVAVHTKNDLAAIICKRPRGVEAAPVRLPSRANDPFINIGHPSYGRTIPHWQVGSYVSLSTNRLYYSVKPFPGMSGGGTFDSEGYLVGVVIAYGREHGISASGPAMTRFVEQFLNSLPEPPADARTVPYSADAPKYERPTSLHHHECECPNCLRRRQEPPRTEPYDEDAPKFDRPAPKLPTPEQIDDLKKEIIPIVEEISPGSGPDVDLILSLIGAIAGLGAGYIAAKHPDAEDDADIVEHGGEVEAEPVTSLEV